jgi:hypothetical protein
MRQLDSPVKGWRFSERQGGPHTPLASGCRRESVCDDLTYTQAAILSVVTLLAPAEAAKRSDAARSGGLERGEEVRLPQRNGRPPIEM